MVKTLAKLLNVASNRTCADCRSTMVDPSQIYVSVSPYDENYADDSHHPYDRFIRPRRVRQVQHFHVNHQAFAPPTTATSLGNASVDHETNGSSQSSSPLQATTSLRWVDLERRDQPDEHIVTSSSSYDGAAAAPPPQHLHKTKSRNPERNSSSIRNTSIDPCYLAARLIGGHGVFVCASCGAAHKLLGPSIAIVRSVQDAAAWTTTSNHSSVLTEDDYGGGDDDTSRAAGIRNGKRDAQRLAASGGNARSWTVLEAYLSRHPTWAQRRMIHAESSVADRLAFIRAKYHALAFVLPPPGPLSANAWKRIIEINSQWRGLWDADLNSMIDLNLNMAGSIAYHQGPGRGRPSVELPDRLVDYFCVVAPSDYIDPTHLSMDLSQLESPEEMRLMPRVIDCFPPQDHYQEEGFEFPEHVSTFLFPEGCHPRTRAVPPSFFTFVLTSSNGDRLYGGVLRLYDDDHDVDYIHTMLQNSGYKGKFPRWMDKKFRGDQRSSSRISFNVSDPSMDMFAEFESDMVYFPKCLVVLSHYPFFDLWRNFLLQIYRISLVEAPLPIERFIANFCCEVPLPPPGKVKVKFGFTVKESWFIERPPENRLPLANFSFKPLFATLSVSNVLVVMGCLLQELRIVLVSKHYAILGPVAEALVSILFPFHWEGMYLPLMPLSMLDILDAPVPYIVGLDAAYLKRTPPALRPHGVVFVDLDRDEVHLGFDDEDVKKPRSPPCLPERQAQKLKAKLDDFAACVYLPPPSGKTGMVTAGHGEHLDAARRNSYLQHSPSRSHSLTTTHLRRRDILEAADRAYTENEIQVPLCNFLSEHGHYHERRGSFHKGQLPRPGTRSSKNLFKWVRPHLSSSDLADFMGEDVSPTSNLLDLRDVSMKSLRLSVIAIVFISRTFFAYMHSRSTFRPKRLEERFCVSLCRCYKTIVYT